MVAAVVNAARTTRRTGREAMTDRIAEEDLAEYIGRSVLADADKLRLFMPDCFARFPLEWDGHLYEISVVYRGPEFKGS